MSDDTDQAEELLQESIEQRRHTTEPTADSSPAESPELDRTAAIKQALQEIDSGDTPENINIRDARLKALLVGLEEVEGLGEVATELAETADTDAPADASQSDIARLLMRVGLQALPDLLEDATEARKQKAIEDADDY